MDETAFSNPPDASEARPLGVRELALLSAVSAKLPHAWILSVRRRRFLFLGMAAPGFLAVFTTTLHHNFFVLVAGFVLFGAAVLFRVLTEPVFLRAQAAEVWPPHPLSSSLPREFPHA
jgi:hypothetical protein